MAFKGKHAPLASVEAKQSKAGIRILTHTDVDGVLSHAQVISTVEPTFRAKIFPGGLPKGFRSHPKR
jgi:hypothetical protein